MTETSSSQIRVAIVTGGTRGIGLAISKRLAADGFDLLITYRGDTRVAQAAEAELRGLDTGRRIEVIAADVSNVSGAEETIATAMQFFGRIDALVNNAGITRDGLIIRMSEQDWDEVVDTNLKGAFLATKAAIRPMLRQRTGRIVNLTSVVGLTGNSGQANYSAAKAGLIGLTRSISKEVGSRGITVNAVAPGYIDTRLTNVLPDDLKRELIASTPVGRIGQPEDIAGAVSFLISPDASFITGHVLSVDGGLSMTS